MIHGNEGKHRNHKQINIIHAKLDSSSKLLFMDEDVISLLQRCNRHNNVLTCLIDIVQRM